MATRTRSATPAARKKATPAAAPAAPAAPAPQVKAVKADKPAKAPKSDKAPRKPKLVRDGFTMPQADFALIAQLKSRALQVQREAKKSELLRAGLHALAALDPQGLKSALDALAPVKVGRPKSGH